MGMSGLVEEGGTWSVEGDVVTVIDPDGEDMPMTLTEDGSLRAEQDGMGLQRRMDGHPWPHHGHRSAAGDPRPYDGRQH